MSFRRLENREIFQVGPTAANLQAPTSGKPPHSRGALAPLRELPSAARELDLVPVLVSCGAAPEVPGSSAEILASRDRLCAQLRGLLGRRFTLDPAQLHICGAKPPTRLAYEGLCERDVKSLWARLVRAALPAAEPLSTARTRKVGFVVTAGNEGIFLRGMSGVIRRLPLGELTYSVVADKAALTRIARSIGRADVAMVPLPPTVPAAVTRLRAEAFELLYFWEVGTDCLNYFLPFFRTAPVQCTSWGWPVTTGMSEIDYFLSSRLVEPSAADEHYCETLIRFDHLPNCYSPPAEQPQPWDRAQFGIRPRSNVYVCVQNPRKIHPEFDFILGAILSQDPRARVVFLESSRPGVSQQLKQRLARALPDDFERIVVAPRMGRGKYLGLLAAADVVLDTIHYGGGANSTYDAWAVGAPVVTLPTTFHRGRYATGAYRAMEVDDCIAYTPRDYIRLAVELANDKGRRAIVSGKITSGVRRIWDDAAPARELAAFFAAARTNRLGPDWGPPHG